MPDAPPSTIIRPSSGVPSLDLRALWEYRELLYFLDLARHQGSLQADRPRRRLGYYPAALHDGRVQSVLRPSRKDPSDGVPYPLFSYTALLPWTYFAFALGGASNSLVGSANLISKVYFPRLVVPISSVLAGLLDFAIAFAVLILLMLWYGAFPTPAIVLLPLFLLLSLVTALGVGLWLSALNVHYRDVRYVIPFLTQAWLFATPVAYPSSLLEEPWRTLYGLNPWWAWWRASAGRYWERIRPARCLPFPPSLRSRCSSLAPCTSAAWSAPSRTWYRL